MKTTNFMGQEIERMQRAAMGSLSALRQVEQAQKMIDLTSAYSVAQDFLKLDSRWRNDIEKMTRAHLSIDHLSSYKTAMASMSSASSAFEAAQRFNQNSCVVPALDLVNASLGSLASKVASDFDSSRRLFHENLGFSDAQTIASAVASQRDIASLKGYVGPNLSQAWERDAMASSNELQASFALARDAGALSIEKALASSIGSLASQYAGQLNVKDRLREMVEGISTFDLTTTASLARYHGVAGLARQMAALGLNPGEYLDDDRLGRDDANAQQFESEHSALSATSLDVLQQLLINIIAAYIWALFLAPALPNPDLDAQNKKIAKVEMLIEKLPQLIESQVEVLIRRQLFAVETFFVVDERTARLRTAPDPGSGVLALAFPNQKLKLLEERGKWIRVEFYDYLAQNLQEGWVLKKYCKRLPPSVNLHEVAVKAVGEFHGAGQGGTVERLFSDSQTDR